MENQLVSILIPTFNSEKFLLEAIGSVQNQTYSNWEIILVDDCSTDTTLTLVAELAQKDKRIHFSKLNKNAGTGVARNTALAEAKGEYIAFLDADDLWKPEKLKKQIDFMKGNNLCGHQAARAQRQGAPRAHGSGGLRAV